MNNVFFSENGLTSTSANRVANLAKEFIQSIESDVQNVQFYNSEVALIGTSEKNLIEQGITDDELKRIPNGLQQIWEAKSLIAWLREAIKARKSLLDAVEKMTLEQYAAENGIELPKCPEHRKTATAESVYAELSVKERNRILSLQAKAATIGKYIHPDGRFADERKKFYDKTRNQHQVKGEGRDTLLYTYTPSCDPDTLEDVFFELQKIHRETQAELNKIEHEVNDKIRNDEMEEAATYAADYSQYRGRMNELEANLHSYKLAESKRIGALKIVIPHDLQDIYDTVNSLGK